MTGAACLAIVTARAGSKGVPFKNIRPLHGRPALEYTLDVAKACPFITKAVVSTDGPEIRDLALANGVEAPFLRPGELAGDLSRQEDAILHAMDWYESHGERFDYICLLEPTTPLRQVATLNRGFEALYADARAQAAFSIAECGFSPVFCNTCPTDGLMKGWMSEDLKWLNRQEIPAYYRLCSLITISRWDVFRRHESFLHDTTLAVPVDPVEATDIDTPFDFFVAERLLEAGFFHSDHLNAYVRRDVAPAASHER